MTARVPRPTALPPADATLVVVEASAGTGKTYFLEHRVVDLVLAGAELANILLVTFTDKAVAELRLRIRDLLDRLARTPDDAHAEGIDGVDVWVIDDVARRRLRAAVAGFDAAPIFTIHGFCHRVLVEDAFAARRLFEQTQVADEVAFDAAFTSLLREQFARVAPERDLLAAFLETDRTVDRLRSILLGCVRAGHDVRVRRRLDPDAARATFRSLYAQLGTEARRNLILRALPKNGNERRWIGGWLDAIGGVFARAEDAARAGRGEPRIGRGTLAGEPRIVRDDAFVDPAPELAFDVPVDADVDTRNVPAAAPRGHRSRGPDADIGDLFSQGTTPSSKAGAKTSTPAAKTSTPRAATSDAGTAMSGAESSTANAKSSAAKSSTSGAKTSTPGAKASSGAKSSTHDARMPYAKTSTPGATPTIDDQLRDALRRRAAATVPPAPRSSAPDLDRELRDALHARAGGDAAADEAPLETVGKGAGTAPTGGMGRLLQFPLARMDRPASGSPGASGASVTPISTGVTGASGATGATATTANDAGDDAFIADLPPARILAWLDEIRDPATKLIGYVSQAITLVGVEAALHDAIGAVSLDEAIAAELLPAIVARIHDDKSEHGQFDYDDMLQLVWRALCGPRREALAARLRERTPWVMIDEFQDTDPVQWNIFRTVWMHPAARGLTIVGDPKQAIYSFRGADVATYLAARDEMLRAGAARVALDVNRRSTVPLVTAVNQILIGNFGMPLLDRTITYDEPVRASGDAVTDDPRAPVRVLAVQSGKGQTDAARTALARAIGDEIEALRASPPVWRKRGELQPFALGHIMVLTRTNRDSVDVAAALRARGLPCSLVEPDRLFRTREASELAAVLAAAAAPRDRSARLRALHTRFFDVPWAELMRVVDAPDHHPLVARIFDWAQLASRRAYETLFRKIVEDSRFAERALVLGGGERAITNTWHIIELLLAEVARSRCDLHELVVQLRRWIADDTSHPDERDVQRAETDADAIRVLTIHKAKGLEAPYVFVFGGMSGGPKVDVRTLREATGRVLVVGNHDPHTRELLDGEADAENQRLAYVALTRAQVRLYLPLYGELPKSAAYLPIQKCLQPLAMRASKPRPAPPRILPMATPTSSPGIVPTNDAFRGAVFGDPAELFEVTQVPVGADAAAAPPPDALADFVAPPPPPTSELAPLPDVRSGLAMLSYTRLARDLDAVALAVRPGDAVALDPAEFDIDAPGVDAPDAEPVELAPGELPGGAGSGLLVHDVLEAADLETARRAPDAATWATDPDVATQLADAARARGVAATYLPHAATIVHRTLVQPFELGDGTILPPLASARSFAREVEFAFPLPSLALGAGTLGPRGLVKGYIDALVAWDDELWVVDYKSDVLGGDLATSAARRVREHYAIQARLYAIAADRLRGRRRLGGLLFVFVRYHIAIPVPAADRIAAWTAWLAELPASPRRSAPTEVT